MLLADVLNASRGGKIDRQYRGAVSALSDEIRAAERFVFSATTIKACENLTDTRPSTLLSALPVCRMPFKNTWFEWECGFKRKNERDNSHPEIPVPVRFGALVECFDDTFRRFGVTYAWVFKENEPLIPQMPKGERAINISTLGAVVNWADKWDLRSPSDVVRQAFNKELKARARPSWKASRFYDSEQERLAMLEICSRSIYGIPPCMVEFVKRVEQYGSYEFKETLLKNAQGDVEGELLLLMCAVCMLNSKNCVSVEEDNNTKINKARQKAKKLPLLSYKTVEINLSSRDKKYAEGNDIGKAELRQHLVRGHFKVRRGGVFWWRPHIRGDEAIGRIVHSRYNVGGLRLLSA